MSKGPTTIDYARLKAFVERSHKRLFPHDTGVNGDVTVAIGERGVGVVFKTDSNRAVGAIDDGSDEGVPATAGKETDSDAIIVQIGTTKLVYHRVVKVTGSYYRLDKKASMLDAQDCVDCIIKNCGVCGGCDDPEPVTEAACLLLCAGICATIYCSDECNI